MEPKPGPAPRASVVVLREERAPSLPAVSRARTGFAAVLAPVSGAAHTRGVGLRGAGMQIRPMTQEDMQAVSDILCSCYRWLADREGYTPEQVDFLLHQRGSLETVRRESQEQLYFVASLHGAIAGMVSVSGNEVTKLYVRPSHHRRGIGAALLRAAASAIAESGFGVMSLGTTPSTVPFYKSLGMSVARTRRPSGGPFTDRDIVVMTMPLDEHAET